MNHLTFLQDMAVVMAVSAVIMILCRRLRLPVVLGYILAGLLIGPHTPPYAFIKDLHSIQTLSEMGVIFLLFSIGLEFSLSKLAKVGLVSFVAATLEILLMIWVGYSLGQLFGWKFMDSLFLGAILSISSTTIIAKVLMDMKKVKEKFAQVILGILIIEDLLAIVIIALLSGVASTGSLEMHEVGVATVRVLLFVGGVLLAGYLLVPRLLRYVAKFQSEEMLVITVLGLCFGVSLAAAKLGFSVALGAFLIGAVIAETKQGKEVTHRIEPIRDMFTAIFFVSVGMMLSPAIIAEYWLFILIMTLATIAGKVMACSSATFLMGYNAETSMKVGLGLAQIGEFSFIIAQLGESTGVTSHFLYPIAVSVSGITTVTTPFLMRNTGPIIRGLAFVTPKPIATLLGFYTGWVEKIGGVRSERKRMVWKGLQLYLPRLLIYGVCACAVFYGVEWLQKTYAFPQVVYFTALVIGLLPFLIGGAYALDRILWNVLFLNLIKSREEVEQAKDVHQTLHRTLRFLMILLVCVILLAVGSSFFPRIPLIIAVLAVVFIAGMFLWDSARKVHDRIEKTVIGIFDREQPLDTVASQAIHGELVKLIREEYPMDVVTEDFLLPYQPSAANQTLRDLRLRAETGATIVAVYRDEESIPNPPAETRLQPGDVLLLMGDQDQVKAAIQFLNKKIKEPIQAVPKREGVPKTQSFTIVPEYAVVGKTLGEIRLRRKTGATVFGLQKAGISVNSPGPDTLVEAGDVLILFGWPDQLKAAFDYLSDLNKE